MRRRVKPPNRLAPHTSAGHVFIVGAVAIVAFLVQTDPVYRAVMVALFATLAWLSGKRIRWGYFAIMVGSITFFHLLSPVGEVLITLGRFRVTRGSLEQGVTKGLAIMGLVFVSLFAVRKELRLPGAFGGMLVRVFYYFERILEGRRRLAPRHLVASIDAILTGVFDDDEGEVETDSGATDARGTIVLIGVTVASVVLALL